MYKYIVILWLSLICKIPFDLARFDEEGSGDVHTKGPSTATRLEEVGKTYLSYASVEGVGAALLLAELYNR